MEQWVPNPTKGQSMFFGLSCYTYIKYIQVLICFQKHPETLRKGHGSKQVLTTRKARWSAKLLKCKLDRLLLSHPSGPEDQGPGSIATNSQSKGIPVFQTTNLNRITQKQNRHLRVSCGYQWELPGAHLFAGTDGRVWDGCPSFCTGTSSNLAFPHMDAKKFTSFRKRSAAVSAISCWRFGWGTEPYQGSPFTSFIYITLRKINHCKLCYTTVMKLLLKYWKLPILQFHQNEIFQVP